MKREEIQKLFTDAKIEVPKETIDKIMEINGTDIQKVRSDLDKATGELATVKTQSETLQAQLTQRDKDIEELKTKAGSSTELQTQLSSLQSKYENDTKDLQTKLDAQKTEMQQKLDAQERDHAAETFFTSIPFASELAKKAALSEFKEKGLKLENGKFLGADDWLNELKKTDPSAFKAEENPNNNPTGQPPATFLGRTNTSTGGNTQENQFASLFNFQTVRERPSDK